MGDLLVEVARFRAWSALYPQETRGGEWECDYEGWSLLHDAVLGFLRAHAFATWSAEELGAVLYAVARDNEIQFLAGQIRERHADLLVPLAAAAAELGESDSQWQLAEELGHLGHRSCEHEAERLLVELAGNGDEYVRRKALQALARLGSPFTEKLALAAWQRPDEHQQWSRMMVLWCLHRLGSQQLPRMLGEARIDGRPHLSAYADRIRRGDVEG